MSLRAAPARSMHFLEQRQRAPDMVARRQFGHDATVLPMHRDLRMQRVREQAALCVVERETGFVAGAFDAENEHDCVGSSGRASEATRRPKVKRQA